MWPRCRGPVGGRNTLLGGGRLVADDAAASGVVWKPGGGLVGGAGICTARFAFPLFLGRLRSLLVLGGAGLSER